MPSGPPSVYKVGDVQVAVVKADAVVDVVELCAGLLCCGCGGSFSRKS